MSEQPVLVTTDGKRWFLGCVCEDQSIRLRTLDLLEDASADQVAEAVAGQIVHPKDQATLQESDHTPDTNHSPVAIPERVPDESTTRTATNLPGGVLGVPSCWCLCGTVSVPDLAPRQRRTAMVFALEEKLPVTAEAVVADFYVTGDSAFGVAVEVRRLRELIDAFERHGVYIDAICPTALLALQHLYKEDRINGSAVAWRGGDGLNLFEFDADKRLQHWRWLKDTGTSSKRIVELDTAEKQWLTQYQVATDESEFIRDDLLEAATWASAQIQTGQIEPLINLRRDVLDVSDRMRRLRVHLLSVFTAAAVLLLAVTGSCLWRAQQYQQAERHYQSDLTVLYHDHFGNQPLPTSVKRRFNTRLRELRGLRGEQIEDTSELETTSALWLLQDVLDRLPTDIRICLLDISIEQSRITIVGQTRTHGDADRIASALRQGNRFQVEPPSTRNLKDGGVSFTLNCTPVIDAPTRPADSKTPTEMAITTRESQAGPSGGVLP